MTGAAGSREEHRAHLRAELAHLESVERPHLLAGLGASQGRDPADQADRHLRELELATVDLRISRLRTRLAELDGAPSDDPDGLGIGTVVVVDLGSGPETFLLAEFPDRGLRAITPGSPLGRAIRDARPGETVAFRAPRGASTVTLLSVGEPGSAAA